MTKEKGHAAHTKAADDPEGYAGEFDRPIKITILGAGSSFTARLMNDILAIKGADRGEIALVDIDEARLGMMKQIVQTVVDARGQSEGWSVCADSDRRKVMSGSDYLICCVEVSGVGCVGFDNDIPLKYGIDQCIGDTIGPGGLFKALRSVPVFLDILRDAAELCPGAIMLNYTNPMNIMCLAAGRAVPEMQVVGLCHSVQGTSHLLARYAEVDYAQMDWECAGINHLAWFTKLAYEGKNLYETVLYEKFRKEVEAGFAELPEGLPVYGAAEKPAEKYENKDLIRKDMCLHFGAFITEHSGHLSEYLPYYRKSKAGRRLLRPGYDGGSRFYATGWPQWRNEADENRAAMVNGEGDLVKARSWEYASWIIEAREKNVPTRIHGNVMNNDGTGAGSLITNLPSDGCVEVACMVDRNGIQPTRYGKLPAQMAAICRSNMAMFDLAATACIEESKEAAIHALMLDPLTAAVCTPREIRAMGEELFEAEKEYLRPFK